MANTQRQKPQASRKHPDEWEKDLNPTRMQGQNLGPRDLDEMNARTAADDKELTRRLAGFDNDELRQIPLVSTGVRLKQGAVYLDLRNPGRGPIVATGDMVARAENSYAPKSEISYEYWNRLMETLCPGIESKAERPQGSQKTTISEEQIDQTLADSFPASDPPSWTTGREHSTANQQTSARRRKTPGGKKSRSR